MNHMTVTAGSRSFIPPAPTLIPWEGGYNYKGNLIKVYFDLCPGKSVETDEFYTVFRLIGTEGSEELLVLGENIIDPRPTGTHLKEGY